MIIVNGRVVNVSNGTISPGGVAIAGEHIAAVGAVEGLAGQGTTVLDAGGAFLTPGLIETHMHAYESNLNPTELAALLLARGTTALPEAMYGPGQIRGIEAVRFLVDELRRTPMNVLLQVPVLGYLQNVELGLPGSPHGLTGEDLHAILDWDGCVGLEEPPFIPMAEKEPVIAALLDKTLDRGKVVMGHGAGLDPIQLAAYAAMGVTADHEAVSAQEALDRIAVGMMVSMRESVVARNQRELQRAITEHGASPERFMFCADVLDPVIAARTGHLDESIRIAVQGGVDPIAAVQMATINAARYYRIDHWLGSLTPGRQADILLVDDLERFAVRSVLVKGRVVVRDGEVVARLQPPRYPAFMRDTVKLGLPVRAETFHVSAPSDAREVVVRVIGAETLVSDERRLPASTLDGAVVADPDRDIAKLAMLDRYGRPEPPAIGFLQGYGLKRGAIGTTYNPMYHNVLVAGVDDADMAVAANTLAAMGGGFVVAAGGAVVEQVPLPLCGLLSDAPADRFIADMEALYRAAQRLGCTMESPFHNLAFTGVCGELPSLKLSHLGPFDVPARRVLPALVDT
jgi:adenine deaminase